MASIVTRRPFLIQDENLDSHCKKAVFDGKTKISKTATKKSGVGFGSRKALNDITNKPSVHHEASSKKKYVPNEEFNVAEERILHDHKRCIKEQQTLLNTFNLDLVLPGYDSVSASQHPSSEEVKSQVDLDIPFGYPEPVEELPMSEFADWIGTTTQWESPPCSPIHWNFPVSSPFAWQFKEVEFVLKHENESST